MINNNIFNNATFNQQTIPSTISKYYSQCIKSTSNTVTPKNNSFYDFCNKAIDYFDNSCYKALDRFQIFMSAEHKEVGPPSAFDKSCYKLKDIAGAEHMEAGPPSAFDMGGYNGLDWFKDIMKSPRNLPIDPSTNDITTDCFNFNIYHLLILFLLVILSVQCISNMFTELTNYMTNYFTNTGAHLFQIIDIPPFISEDAAGVLGERIVDGEVVMDALFHSTRWGMDPFLGLKHTVCLGLSYPGYIRIQYDSDGHSVVSGMRGSRFIRSDTLCITLEKLVFRHLYIEDYVEELHFFMDVGAYV